MDSAKKKWDFTPEERERFKPLKRYWGTRFDRVSAIAFLAGGLWACLVFFIGSLIMK